MRSKLPLRAHCAIAVSAAAAVTAAALVVALAPEASAAPAAPLPLPVAQAGGEPLVNIDGHVFAQPLVNNLTLPTPK
ncbi:hypothetical protein [Streptomyces chromofuscus]|uniref:Secreted protein n=1 Tax=Streptomyces chromofuscus TaxID=42881 RepID=A0A7M2THC9_STRCW|nr:hypothetical protein [Streptomyces chromofuscus]QOV47315.1 hypothetical protein IPT68_16420 [Streptomyces chromofuscus]GGT25031.1 hypothetical protein GCM10010254_51890 [Streptomyces chromofuscus]